MKRYLVQLTALSLLALATGCQKEQGEINNPQNNQSAAVNISIDGLSIDAASSRAVIADMPDFSKNGFKIAGYYTDGTAPIDPNPGKSGRFDDNITTATPNVFDHKTTEGSVIVPQLKEDGKYHVTLSQWGLSENSYLSYFAWASNVDAGVAEGAAENPIVISTKHGITGAPFIQVTSGSTSASLNVDVVAAKSTDNSNDVVRSAIDLDFKHVMTKLKFSVKNSSSVAMTLTGAKILFEAGKVSRNAKYSFDGSTSYIGTWSDYTNTEAATYPVTLTPTNLVSMGAAVPLDELLIIPQALDAEAISVELTYTIPNGATASTYTRTAPLKARTYEQNTSYTYEIALNETQISINEGRIGAWIDTKTGDLPYVVGARDPKVLLLLDGYDPPYTHTDGNKYWLDRSGWNRHCKLVGNVTYYAPEKQYYFSGDAGAWLEAPAFASTTEATIDVITKTLRSQGQSGVQNLLYFSNSSDARVMYTHFGYNGTKDLYFDAGQTSNADNKYTRVHALLPYSLMREVVAMYSFSKSATNQAIYRNLIYQYNTLEPAQSGHGKVDLSTATSRRFGVDYRGDVKYIKVSSVAKPQITKVEYADLAKRHKIPQSDYLAGYVKTGLVLDLQGVNAPIGGYWKDLSGSGADAKLVGDVIYDPVKKEYQTRPGGYLDVTIPAAWKVDQFFDNYAIELVYNIPKKPDGSFYDERHNQFIMLDASGQRVIFFHMGYSTPEFACNFQSHTMYANRNYNDGGALISNRHSYYAGAGLNTGTYMEFRVDNGFHGSQTAENQRHVKGAASLRIGENAMNISAVRIYNNWKSNTENKDNVAIDKVYYNIP